MQFTEDLIGSDNIITRYGSGFIEVNQTRFEHSILVFPDLPTTNWDCTTPAEVTTNNLQPVSDYAPEVLLIGSGTTFAFPEYAVQAYFLSNGIGCEVMDSAAACRTYNVLLSERRKVAAALILP